MEIRNVEKKDLEALKTVLESTELFPPSMLDDMISDYFENPESEDIWLTFEHEGIPIAIAYCAPEKLTEGTYNLYAIGVLKEHQGSGIGHKIMNYLEHKLRSEGNRILIVETSGADDFELTRKFYRKCHYVEQAVIPEFYAEGDDKVVFWKKLK